MIQMKLQTIYRAAVAATLVVSAGATSAASQAFEAINGVAAINGSVLAAQGVTVITLGNATFTDNMLYLPVASVSTAAEGGAALIDFGDADGFTLQTALGSVSFKDFSFDFATKTLKGDMQGLSFLSGISLLDSGLITATVAEGNLGLDDLSAVSTQAAARPLYLSASSFVMAADLTAYLTQLQLPLSTFPVAQAVTTLNIGTPPAVPEPSTYAMLGMGLAIAGGMAARKRRA